MTLKFSDAKQRSSHVPGIALISDAEFSVLHSMSLSSTASMSVYKQANVQMNSSMRAAAPPLIKTGNMAHNEDALDSSAVSDDSSTLSPLTSLPSDTDEGGFEQENGNCETLAHFW